MDVNNVMSTYNLNSLWNNLNPNNSSSATVPLINNINSTVKENYTAMNYSGQTTSTELQDIYKQVVPNYGLTLIYNQNGTLSMPISTPLPTNGLTPQESATVSLLDTMNSSTDNSMLNILSQYNSIEDGTSKSNISSILFNNPITLYNAVDLLGANQTQNFGNYINLLV